MNKHEALSELHRILGEIVDMLEKDVVHLKLEIDDFDHGYNYELFLSAWGLIWEAEDKLIAARKIIELLSGVGIVKPEKPKGTVKKEDRGIGKAGGDG